MPRQMVEYDGIKFYRNSRSGYYEARVRLHRYKVQRERGPIPDGHHVHHGDGDKANNSLDNLELLTVGEHSAAHMEEKIGPHRAKALARSMEARARNGERRLAERELHCPACLGSFRSSGAKPRRFCSEHCRSVHRAAAFTPEVRKCVQCGGQYTAAKRVQKYCGKGCNMAAFYQRRRNNPGGKG